MNEKCARKYRSAKENDSDSSKFEKLMKKGKVGPIDSGEIRPLTYTTRKELQKKHPSAKIPPSDTKIERPQRDENGGIFVEINGLMI